MAWQRNETHEVHWPAWTSRLPSTWHDQSILRLCDQEVHGWITAALLPENGSSGRPCDLPSHEMHPSRERCFGSTWQGRSCGMSSQNGREQMELHIETLPRRRSLNLQLCVGGQALDPVSLEDAPGADDEGLDRGGGEVGPNLQVSGGQALTLSKRWTTLRSRRGQGSTKYRSRRVSRFLDTPSIRPGGCTTAWMKGCTVQTRPAGEMRSSTEAKTYHGESNAEEWWSNEFRFGSESWSWRRAMMDRIKGWETKAMRCLFRFERKEDETLRMMDKDGDGGKNELEKDEAPFFFRKCLTRVCGEPWCGHVTQGHMPC